MSSGIFEGVRQGAARVMERARSVSMDTVALETLSRSRNLFAPSTQCNPIDYYVGAPADTVAYILTLDAINFGSGYFPYLAKRPGHSGYFTIASSLRENWESEGPWDANQLAATSADDCARIMNQNPGVPEVAELMSLFSRALNDLGEFLLKRFAGDPGRCRPRRRMLGRVVAQSRGQDDSSATRYGPLDAGAASDNQGPPPTSGSNDQLLTTDDLLSIWVIVRSGHSIGHEPYSRRSTNQCRDIHRVADWLQRH